MSNRLVAQRTKMRRVEHIDGLEKRVKDLQDIIAWVKLEIENVKDNKNKLQLENKMLQEQLDSFTRKSNLLTVQIDELKHELKRLKELARAQEHGEHVKIEGQNSNSYDHSDSESTTEIDMDQYISN